MVRHLHNDVCDQQAADDNLVVVEPRQIQHQPRTGTAVRPGPDDRFMRSVMKNKSESSIDKLLNKITITIFIDAQTDS